MTHTPGPWHINEENRLDGEYSIFTGNTVEDANEHIASISGGLGFNGECCYESQANTALIAAAPDLLEALKAMYRACSCEANHTVLEIAKEAIAKAEGK